MYECLTLTLEKKEGNKSVGEILLVSHTTLKVKVNCPEVIILIIVLLIVCLAYGLYINSIYYIIC